MLCPKCNQAMEPSISRGVASFTCKRCSGVWIGGDALHDLFAREQDSFEMHERFEALLDSDFNESLRDCPGCVVRKLKSVFVDGIELDFCVSCKGVYFDQGELDAVYARGYMASGKSIAGMLTSTEDAFWAGLIKLFGGNK